MTKTLKKGISLLVVLMMLMSMAPSLVFASETEAVETTLVYTIDAHEYISSEGQELNETGDGGPEVGFRKEVESGKNIISYIKSGLKLTYSVNFESEVTNMDVLLAYAKNEYAGGFTMTVEVDGDEIGTTKTFGHKGTNFSGYSTHDVAMSSPISAGEHTISITFGASVNFYGIEFYNCPQIDAFESVDPTAYSYYQKGTLVPTGTNNASLGFEQSEDTYGKNISWVKSGLTFVYKNVYFEEAPYDFTINLGTHNNTSEKVKVYIDGALLENLNTTASGKSYTPSPYSARVSGIEARSTHEITVVIQQNGGVNFYGFRFASCEQKNGLGFINAQTWDATSGKLNTDTPNASLGFTHENDDFGVPIVSYITAGTKFEYKNLYFEKAAHDFEIKLGSYNNISTKANVYIDGIKLEKLNTTAEGVYYTKPNSYSAVLPEGLILAGSIHDVTVEIADGVNFSGFGFYAKRDGLGFINGQTWDATSGKLNTSGTGDASLGFTHQNDAYGVPLVSYITAGTKFEYKNLYFDQAAYDFEIKLATYKNTDHKANVYIDGIKLEALDTTAEGVYYDKPNSYGMVLPEGLITAGSVHDVTIEIAGSTNYSGFGFYAKRNGFDFVNPQSWDDSNKSLAPTGTNNANIGFEHDNDSSGNPMVSYIPVGIELEYHNLYFAKAPETLTLYIMTAYADQMVDVKLADGTVLGSITTTAGGSWSKATSYQVDVTGKIAAGTICDVVLSSPTAGFNYCGMQFDSSENDKLKDAFDFINPQSYDDTNGTLNTSGTGDASAGFRHETDSDGYPMISYLQKGLTFRYNNLYFDKAPESLTLYILTMFAGETLEIALADGTVLGMVTTLAGSSWSKTVPYDIDISGKIAAGSTCDIVVTCTSGGYNFGGMQFSDTKISIEEELDNTENMNRIRSIAPYFSGSYKTVDGVRLPIKIFKPEYDNGRKTAFLIIHGGAWYAVKEDSSSWDGSNMLFQAQYYADKGYQTAAISYRGIDFTDSTTAFDILEDCKDAISYMKNNMEFDKLVIMGESAGGHLAVQLGLDDEVGADVIVGFNPVLDCVNKWTMVAKNDTDRKALSPAFNVKKTDTDFLIMHGDADTDVDPEVSEKFCADMTEAGTDCKYIGLENETHSFIISRYKSTDENVFKYMKMVDDYLDSRFAEEYFKTYKSNTTAALGNQYTFISNGKEQTGRIFFKISAGGTYNYSFTFSGTVDTTYADGSVAKANKICPDYTITELKVAPCTAEDVKKNYNSDFDFKQVTFLGGNASVKVDDGATVYTDPVELTFNADDFVCMQISYKGTEIPKIINRMVSSYILTDGIWVSSGDMPIPGFIGCDRDVKKSVLFIGDSITMGVGTNNDSYEHWVSKVEELMGDDYSYQNIGLGFARAADAATDGAWLNKAKYADYVVVCLGVNDIYHATESVGEQVCGYYDAIVEALSDGKRKIMFQTVPPFDYSTETQRADWNMVNTYIRETLSKKVDCVFDTVPVLRASEEAPYQTVYGQHPNAEGCQKWAEALAPVLKTRLIASETVNFDANTRIVTLNSTPDMAGKVAFIASYTNGGRLVNVMKRDVTYTEGTPQTIGISEILTGADKIKVFIWESLSNLVPVIESEEFNI